MAAIIKREYVVKGTDGKPVLDEDGKPVRRTYAHWTIQYRDAAGKIQRIKGYKDKSATKQLAAEIERKIARGEQGLVDPFKVAKARQLSEHLANYIANLKSAGRDPKYIQNMNYRLQTLFTECPWKVSADIDPDSFRRWREDRQKIGHKRGSVEGSNGASPRTMNQYLQSASAYCNWMVEAKRMAINPLAKVSPVVGAAVRNRRGLTDDEVAKLLAAAPEARRIVYRTGLSVGLRRQELADLKWGDVGIRAIRPYIQLRAEATKARRGDRLALPASLAEDLRKYRPEGATDAQAVFPAVPPIEDWKADLAAAGIAYKDAMGRQADFHGGTRKTLCTRMQRGGVPLAQAMRVMRHTDVRLTMVDYVDDEQMGLADAMPEIPAAEAE